MKSALKWTAIFIFGIFGGVFGAQILWPYFVEKPLFLQYRLEQNPAPVIEKKEIYIQENTALQEIVRKVEKSVVNIEIKTKKGKIETTGLISASDGTILAISQNIPPAFSQITVNGDEFSAPATILKQDKNLSLLKIKKDNLPTVSFSETENINLGERAFYLTKLFDENTKKPIFSVNAGFVSKIYPNVIYTNMYGQKEEIGSPLFNIKGELLGIIFLDKSGKVEAIPISAIKTFLGL